jgi:hypothetical protein
VQAASVTAFHICRDKDKQIKCEEQNETLKAYKDVQSAQYLLKKGKCSKFPSFWFRIVG